MMHKELILSTGWYLHKHGLMAGLGSEKLSHSTLEGIQQSHLNLLR
jgi:hypothetical protein